MNKETLHIILVILLAGIICIISIYVGKDISKKNIAVVNGSPVQLLTATAPIQAITSKSQTELDVINSLISEQYMQHEYGNFVPYITEVSYAGHKWLLIHSKVSMSHSTIQMVLVPDK